MEEECNNLIELLRNATDVPALKVLLYNILVNPW